jgi:2-haloacid dehalogenase
VPDTIPTVVSDRTPTVVFDIGGVLVDWDPRHLYRKLLPADEVDAFLAEVDFHTWNARQDAGRSWADGVIELAAKHPHRRELIAAYPERYWEAVAGPIEGTVTVLRQLHERGVRLLALTNWSAETFPQARRLYPFLGLLDGIVVSGEEGVAKPDPEIFRRLRERYDVAAGTPYVDDSPVNVEAATAAGLDGIHFTGPDALHGALAARGVLP